MKIWSFGLGALGIAAIATPLSIIAYSNLNKKIIVDQVEKGFNDEKAANEWISEMKGFGYRVYQIANDSYDLKYVAILYG